MARALCSADGGEAEQEALFARMGANPALFAGLRQGLDVQVMPQNWNVVQCFLSLRTQWRSGTHGTTGLDYAVLPRVMKWHGIPARARGKVFWGLQIMEDEVLTVVSEKRQGS